MSGAFKTRLDSNFRKSLHASAGVDHGVITAFLAVTLTGLSILFSAVLMAAELLVLNQKLVATVDLAALVASDTHRGLISGSVCENAELILESVDFAMTTCRIVGSGVMVSGFKDLVFTSLKSSAIAGENRR